jgi:hypothetical protein
MSRHDRRKGRFIPSQRDAAIDDVALRKLGTVSEFGFSESANIASTPTGIGAAPSTVNSAGEVRLRTIAGRHREKRQYRAIEQGIRNPLFVKEVLFSRRPNGRPIITSPHEKSRNRLMRLAALTAAACGLVFSQPALCAETAMFRGDPQHSGVYQTGPLRQFTGVKWKFKTNGYVVSSPALADGTVYFGSTDGALYAVDRDAGTLKWKAATGSRVVSSPAVANGIVYFGSYDGKF